MGTKKKHQLIVFENGGASLTDPTSGEAMHSLIGAWEEANTLYIGQSQLKERLSLKHPSPVVIYDLGIGIAANALAALHCQSTVLNSRPLEIISFENDLDGLRTALSQLDAFPFLRAYSRQLHTLLETGEFLSDQVRWILREGDFLKQDLSQDTPELIFFDFYSPKSGSDLWTTAVFSKLKKLMEKNPASNPLLLTYSAATPVRVGMLLAGFCVGKGIQTSAKFETTLATLRINDLANPLSQEWLQKLHRSNRYTPFGMETLTRQEIIEQVKKLSQFSQDRLADA